MSPLIVYTEYRCEHCMQHLTLSVEVYHTKDYSVAQEYALVVNDNRPEMLAFEKLHSQHVYTYQAKLEPIGA